MANATGGIANSVVSTARGPKLSTNGLGSGLDINSIVDALVNAESVGKLRVEDKITRAQGKLAAYNLIKTDLNAVQSASSSIRRAVDWNAYRAASSKATAATATVNASAIPGSLSFTVDTLATAHTIRSTGTVSATSSVIASSPVMVSAAAGLGLSALAASNDLATGSHTIAVTQASAAATKTATTTLAASTTITTGVNDTIDVEINGTATTLTLDAGTYTRQQLATAIGAKSGGALVGAVDTGNRLVVSTASEGSAATIKVTGGLAIGDLGLDADAAAITGTDGIVAVDGQANTVTNVTAGGIAVLNSTTGTITATFAGGLRVGSATAAKVGVGTGTLAEVANNINAAKAGVTATVVQVAAGQYRLQLASSASGAASRLAVDPNVLAAMGGSTTLESGQNAQITIGSGPGAYSVTSATNTVRDVVPGVTLNLVGKSTDPVTISIDRDADAIAGRIQKIVDTANQLVADIKQYTAYDAEKRQSSVLTGDSTVRRIQNTITTAVISSVTSSSIGSAGLVGLSTSKDGTLTFDQAKFMAKFTSDPDGVRNLFVAGASATNSSVSLNSLGDRTQGGTYAVNITQAAARAERAGADLSGQGAAITDAETIDVKVGTTTVSYAASAGASLASIATGLNSALSAARLTVVASVEDSKLVLRSTDFGSGQKFSVRTNTVASGQTGIASVANAWAMYSGTDVAGTIGGRAASGRGQLLTVNADQAQIPLLSLRVSATSAGPLGTVTLNPGVAQRLSQTVAAAVDPIEGSLTAVINGSRAQIDDLNKQDADWSARIDTYTTRLRAQFSTLDSTLGTLKSQQNWMNQQFNNKNTSS